MERRVILKYYIFSIQGNMRVLVFSDKKDYISAFKEISAGISTNIYVEHVKYDQQANIALTSHNNIYILDDRLYESFDKDYLAVLERLQVEVIVLLRDRKNVKRYMSLNIIDYFLSPVDWEAMNRCIRRAYKRFEIIMRLDSRFVKNSKFIIKTKTDAFLLNFKDILFFEKTNKIVTVHTRKGVYETSHSLISIEKMVPNYHFRVHDSYIVNFDQIYKIEEIHSRTYCIEFEGYEYKAKMSRFKSKEIMKNHLGKHRMSFAVESVKKECN